MMAPAAKLRFKELQAALWAGQGLLPAQPFPPLMSRPASQTPVLLALVEDHVAVATNRDHVDRSRNGKDDDVWSRVLTPGRGIPKSGRARDRAPRAVLDLRPGRHPEDLQLAAIAAAGVGVANSHDVDTVEVVGRGAD